jgi:hypothetical protein
MYYLLLAGEKLRVTMPVRKTLGLRYPTTKAIEIGDLRQRHFGVSNRQPKS